MSAQEPLCMMNRDGYGCDGKSEVLLVIYEDNTSDLICRKCIKENKKDLVGIKAYTIGHIDVSK
jgi:hypothetical protein